MIPTVHQLFITIELPSLARPVQLDASHVLMRRLALHVKLQDCCTWASVSPPAPLVSLASTLPLKTLAGNAQPTAQHAHLSPPLNQSAAPNASVLFTYSITPVTPNAPRQLSSSAQTAKPVPNAVSLAPVQLSVSLASSLTSLAL